MLNSNYKSTRQLVLATVTITFLLLRHVRSFQAAKFINSRKQYICFSKPATPHLRRYRAVQLRGFTLFSSRAMDESEKPVKPRRSTRQTMKGNKNAENDEDDSSPSKSGSPEKIIKKKIVKRKIIKRKVSRSTSDGDTIANSGASPEEVPKRKITKKKIKRKVTNVTSTSPTNNDSARDDTSSVSSVKRPISKKAKISPKGKVKKAKVEPQRITERDKIPKLWDAKEAMEKHGSYTFKILSWNVAGLRGLLKKQPNALPDLAAKHDIDLLCLQETKLQEMHVLDPKLKIKEILDKAGFDSHYSCSTVKKGYSGTATYIKRRNTNSDNAHGSAKSDEKPKKKQAALGAFFPAKTETETDTPVTGSATSLGDININHLVPVNVSFTMGDKDHDGEGRIIALDFPQFTIMNCYVPNAGSKLERLAYRTEQWDKTLLQFMQDKEKERGVPVIWLGDLNVAHKAYDVWNDGAKHLAKQPGVTQEERDSFQMQLDADGGAYVDAFRYLFPDAKGHYTFWSQRAGNRPPNKGLRLDYFICSKALFLDEKKQKVLVRDSYMLPEQDGSDHCPVVLEIEIRK